MNVQSLPQDEGMLFVFGDTQRLSFWGQNTFIPLDIAFLDDDGVILKIAQIEPHSLQPVSCSGCSMAIEANAGYFEDNDISEGYRVREVDEPLVISHGYRMPNRHLLSFDSPI